MVFLTISSIQKVQIVGFLLMSNGIPHMSSIQILKVQIVRFLSISNGIPPMSSTQKVQIVGILLMSNGIPPMSSTQNLLRQHPRIDHVRGQHFQERHQLRTCKFDAKTQTSLVSSGLSASFIVCLHAFMSVWVNVCLSLICVFVF